MRERDVEIYLRDQVKLAGGIAFKFTSPGNAGVPDRLVLFPGGRVVFAEIKRPGGKPTVLQQRQMTRIRALGHEVRVLDSKESVDDLIQELTVRGS